MQFRGGEYGVVWNGGSGSGIVGKKITTARTPAYKERSLQCGLKVCGQNKAARDKLTAL